MYVKAEIINFQSHAKTVFALDQGATVFTGTSDSGKSSIMRALYWLFFNKPEGFAFRSTFAKEDEPTEVSIWSEAEEGVVKITRHRSNKLDCYRVDAPGEEIAEYKALKGKVPEEVQAYFNMNKRNFQTQAEQYYLIDQTSSTIAKEFNTLTNLEVMDKCIKQINTMVKAARSGLSYIESEINENTTDVNALDWVPYATGKFDEILDLEEELEKVQKEAYNVQEIISEYNEIEEVIHEQEELLFGFREGLEELMVIDAGIEEHRNELTSVCAHIEYNASIDAILNSNEYIPKAKLHLQSLIEMQSELSPLSGELKQIKNWMDYFVDVAKREEETGDSVNETRAIFEDKKKELGVCPLCETVL